MLFNVKQKAHKMFFKPNCRYCRAVSPGLGRLILRLLVSGLCLNGGGDVDRGTNVVRETLFKQLDFLLKIVTEWRYGQYT